jgi:uracil-DNA glycosylase
MKSLSEIMALDWAEVLEGVEPEIRKMGDFLRDEAKAGRRFLPVLENIFRAFQTPLKDIKVLIVGQDPYPDPRYPVGLSFSVKPDVKLIPQSLQNIYKEIISDIGGEMPKNGDLTSWVEQGVLLLNRTLTVQVGKPNSHQGKGWEKITETAIKALNDRNQPLVAILWGNNARQLKEFLTNDKIKIIESVHPSPLSASRGFFGSKPFSQTNEYLRKHDLKPIEWAGSK